MYKVGHFSDFIHKAEGADKFINSVMSPKSMLKRMLDTSGIDVTDPEIMFDLETDLRRMDKLRHGEIPEGVDVYRVNVTPSDHVYMPGMYRFKYEIQYGNVEENEFEPKGEPVFYQTETLPMI